MAILDDALIDERVREGVVAIGNFDGVHRGHQAMMRTLRREADRLGAPAVAATFDPPPIDILRPGQSPPRLMTLDDKRDLLREAGADVVLTIPTSRELLALSAEEFFDEVLRGQLRVRGLVEGPNFRFGRGRQGDIALLETLTNRAGLALAVVEPIEIAGELVSSSRIRQLVSHAELPQAENLLGRPHRVRGRVVRGAARGATLGFPTANLEGIAVLLPPPGVYAGRVRWEERAFAAAIHLGPNSSFDESETKLEVYLLDFHGDLYGQTLCVEFLAQVRETQRFSSREALIKQMDADCADVRAFVSPK